MSQTAMLTGCPRNDQSLSPAFDPKTVVQIVCLECPLPTPVAKAAVKPSETPKKATKSDLTLGLLRRAEGATLDQMVEATGWLPHSTRAALTGLKKKGHMVTSEKLDGVRTYRVAASSDA